MYASVIVAPVGTLTLAKRIPTVWIFVPSAENSRSVLVKDIDPLDAFSSASSPLVATCIVTVVLPLAGVGVGVGIGVLVGVGDGVGVKVGVGVGAFGSVVYVTTSFGASVGTPSNASAVLWPVPVTINTIALPLIQPGLFTTSWTTKDRSGVLYFWLTVHTSISLQTVEPSVFSLLLISPLEAVNVAGSSAAWA